MLILMLIFKPLAKRKKRQFKESEKGMALIEAIPVLFLLVLIFNFSLGFFGAIHSGILNSIGAYNYSIETFRFKSNLMYFRPGASPTSIQPSNYKLSKNRVHGVTKDGSEQDDVVDKKTWPTTVRNITFNFVKNDPKRGLAGIAKKGQVCDDNGCRSYDKSASGNVWKTADPDYKPDPGSPIQTPRIWIKTVYGMCISADCESR